MTVVVRLVEIDWPGRVLRYWPGSWRLTTLDGRQWEPVGEAGGLSPVRSSSATVIDTWTLSLSASYDSAEDGAALAAAIRADFRADVAGRTASIWLQAIDPSRRDSSGRVLLDGAPVVETVGRLSSPTVTHRHGYLALSVTITGLLSGGSVPPLGLATESDQRERYPDDGLLAFLPIVPERLQRFRWP